MQNGARDSGLGFKGITGKKNVGRAIGKQPKRSLRMSPTACPGTKAPPDNDIGLLYVRRV